LQAEIDRFWTTELDMLVAEARELTLQGDSMSYTRTITLPVSPDEAFALVTQPERLRRWQTVSATVDLRAGGEYRWTVTPGHYAGGTFREVEPGRRIVFGWGWDGSAELPFDASTATIPPAPVPGGTALTLTHEGLTATQAEAHAAGWDHFLERLERLVAAGDAGPDEWSWAPEGITPIVAAEATLAVLQPVLRALTAEDKTKQTPCDDYDCHGLAEHLFGSIAGVGDMVGVEVTNPGEGTLEDHVSVMAGRVIDALAAYDAPEVVGGGLPTAAAPTILSIEFLLHAWDFAQATGQQVRVSEEVVAWVAEHAAQIIEDGRGRGAFAAEVAADAYTSALDRLAAFSGRRAA
jgi:uncharacterized protein (TIGR03086 family)